MRHLTPDGYVVLHALATAATIYTLWLALQAARNNGVARVWHVFMFGWGGVTIAPWLVLISTSAEATIPAHEQIHVKQMRELGSFGFAKFWWRYLTDKQQRLAWEVEAYREWLAASPQDHFKVLGWLEHNYNTGLSRAQLLTLLADTN